MTRLLKGNIEYKTFQSLDADLQAYLCFPTDDRESIDYVLLHGYGDHFFRYQQFVELFLGAGKSIAGFDLTGFGRSSGENGFISDFQNYIQNMNDFLTQEFIATRITENTKFIGFSMGGNVTTQYMFQSFKENEIFLISPMLKLHLPASDNLNKIIDSLETFAPDLNIYSGIIPPTKIYKDEFVHGNLTPSLARNILKNQGEEFITTLQMDNKITIVHADKDPVCDIRGSKQFVEQNPNAELVEMNMLAHELLELEPKKIFEIIMENNS